MTPVTVRLAYFLPAVVLPCPTLSLMLTALMSSGYSARSAASISSVMRFLSAMPALLPIPRIAAFTDRPCRFLLCSERVMLLAPRPDMLSDTELASESPTVMMPMTLPMPMMMPSIVRSARILLARRLESAIWMFSNRFTAIPPAPAPRPRARRRCARPGG